jgi:TRAP transporter TAXI family solute receptor
MGMIEQGTNEPAKRRLAGGRGLPAAARRFGIPAATGLGLMAVILGAAALVPMPAETQEIAYFRIGTGTPEASYFSIGGVIASAISNPPGSRDCDAGGNCGVPGLIALAQTTPGSVANLRQINEGALDSGLVQADIAESAFMGVGPFKESGPDIGLRAIANLYQEGVHVVVRADSGIESVAGLKHKRVAIGEKESDSYQTARLLLSAYNLSEKRVKPAYLPVVEAAQKLAAGELDAIIVVGSYPIPAIADLAATLPIKLLPINDAAAQKLREEHPYLTVDIIPDGAYAGIDGSTVTLGIGALWVVDSSLDDDLVYEITRAIWHPSIRKLLDDAGPVGRKINVNSALLGLPIPLHPGAARYYTEIGQTSQPPAPAPAPQ